MEVYIEAIKYRDIVPRLKYLLGRLLKLKPIIIKSQSSYTNARRSRKREVSNSKLDYNISKKRGKGLGTAFDMEALTIDLKKEAKRIQRRLRAKLSSIQFKEDKYKAYAIARRKYPGKYLFDNRYKVYIKT